jgi:hypothetical protein
VTLIGQFIQRRSITFGTTGGILDPFKSARSGINRSQGGCGPPPGISPSIGVLPKATIPPTIVTVPTPRALWMASQGDCAALTITASISTSTGGGGATAACPPALPAAGLPPPGAEGLYAVENREAKCRPLTKMSHGVGSAPIL